MKVKGLIKTWFVVTTVATVVWSVYCLRHDLRDVDRRFPD